MKLLVSTKETQGHRENDFCFVPDSEFVTFPVIECTGEGPDDKCGCRRSMSGLISKKGTTTFGVVDRQMTQRQFEKKVYQSMKNDGWVSRMGEKNVRDFAKTSTNDIAQAVKKFPVGTILERSGDLFKPRT
ncbi:MAG: hypothetical protein Q8R26_01465 [bacterium]|nr:hypothetical protein [bacterium]